MLQILDGFPINWGFLITLSPWQMESNMEALSCLILMKVQFIKGGLGLLSLSTLGILSCPFLPKISDNWLCLRGFIIEHSIYGHPNDLSEYTDKEADNGMDWVRFPRKDIKNFFQTWNESYRTLKWITLMARIGMAVRSGRTRADLIPFPTAWRYVKCSSIKDGYIYSVYTLDSTAHRVD